MSEPGLPDGGGADKRTRAEEVLTELLRLMEAPSKVEVRDGADGGLSAAVFPEGELPGLGAGKRSSVTEALQFLANKIVNRGGEKRWIAVGVGGHPEPRAKGGARPAAAAPAAPAASAVGQSKAPARKVAPAKGPSGAGREPDEGTVEVQADPAMEALGRALAEQAARLGRLYAVGAMGLEARAGLLRGAAAVEKVTVRSEGEGRHRRLVFVPAEVKPMPRPRAFPLMDDEDDDEPEA
jgi:predicted RNA-binding protein Jag